MQPILDYLLHNWNDVLKLALEHLDISLVSIIFAMVIAIPLGIFSTRCRSLTKLFKGIFGTLRVIPSLAILILCIPIMGTGMKPAVTALAVLAIPPVLINTTLAFQTLPGPVLETAYAMGMGRWRMFFTVKFPLAFPLIFTGIKTAVVEVIASATLAAYIGAGGLGSLIFTGLGLMRTDLLIIGGASVAILSLLSGYLLNLLDHRITRYKNPGK
ncbi:ABC transporter permease [Anaerocolumna chitinilytica]|uniref:Glycine/betaine ABC transporter permease n=1 Tax=Anaerocolumna chitinilytica TaxID=1727145 RepID=A0A7I8DHF9_9FIRM|nr:ABC transporter permease [Anaerocolumna chitinilytica]BCJ97772.1 glycine/betaine ABC transporter permease [Anaerocolumna chitinilytica]